MSRAGWVFSGVAAVGLALIVILVISETASAPPLAAPSAADKPVPTPQPASGPSNQPPTPAQTAAAATSGSPPGNSSPTTWNPADKARDMVLANDNMSAIKEGQKNSWASVRASKGKTAGKWFFRLKVDTTSREDGWIGGIASAAAPLSDYIGDEAQGAGFQTSKNFWQSGQNHSNAWSGAAQGDIVDIAVDLGTRKIWAGIEGSHSWNGSPQKTPASGQGGLDFAPLQGPVFPAWSGFNGSNAERATLDTGTPVADPGLAGFSSWDSQSSQ
jgi:hypothetical protein